MNVNSIENMDYVKQVRDIYRTAIMDRRIDQYRNDSDEGDSDDDIVEAISTKQNKTDRDEHKLVIRTNIMVIDVETAKTGELIQIAYNIYDEEFNVIKQFDSLINEYNGKIDFYEKYSLDEIMCDGRDVYDVFYEIQDDMEICSHVVGHNISFDMGKIHKYFTKLEISYIKPISICTMAKSKQTLNLKNKRGHIKPPKLSELFVYCFGHEPDNSKTHTADYDIEITFMCFYKLYVDGIILL